MASFVKRMIPFHPRALLHSLLTYPRFLGKIKPHLLASREAEVMVQMQSINRVWERVKLEAPIGKRILVIAPHPDDEAIGAGGFILAHRGKSEVHIVNIYNGEGGGQLLTEPWQDSPEYKLKLVLARQKELTRNAQILGVASVQHLDMPDGKRPPDIADAEKLRKLVEQIDPEVVLLPWYLDNQSDHRVANILYSWGCAKRSWMVLGYEIWTLCQPNAVLDISDYIDEKLKLVKLYETQNTSIDYSNYVKGLGTTRAFLLNVRPKRNGFAEAFFTLPNRDYCELVQALYGKPGKLTPAACALI